MEKGSIWSSVVLLFLIIAIAAILLFVVVGIGKWGTLNAKNISKAIDITKYV